jgi:hypothetical protein
MKVFLKKEESKSRDSSANSQVHSASDESLESKLSSLEKETSVLTASIEKIEGESDSKIQEFAAAVYALRKEIASSVSSTISSFKFYIWTVFASWIIGGVGIGYSLSRFATENLTIGFVVFWTLVGSVVLWQAKNKRDDLQQNNRILSSSIIVDETDNEASPKVNLSQQFSITQALSENIRSAFGTIAKSAVELTPKLSDIVDLRTKKVRQEHFISDFVFALQHYRIVLDYSEIQTLRRKKYWLYDDEELWLDDSIAEVRKKFLKNASAAILKLVFYDATNQKPKISPVWQEVQNSSILREELSSLLIGNKLLNATNLNSGSVIPLCELLLELPIYSLIDVSIVAREFFDKLEDYKASIIVDLETYGLGIQEERDQISNYMPSASLKIPWKTAVLDYMAGILKIDKNIVRLLVRDIEEDFQRLDAWKIILKSHFERLEKKDSEIPDLLEELSVVLSRKRIKKPFEDFREPVFLAHLIKALESFQDSFSPSDVELTVRTLEAQIIRVRRNVDAVSRRYKLQTKRGDFYEEFCPRTIHAVEQDFVSQVAPLTDVSSKIFEILYYSLITPEIADELFLKLKKENSLDHPIQTTEISQLANFMISKKFVPSGAFNSELETLLITQQLFDLNRFVQLYFDYERLKRSSDALIAFLSENKILHPSASKLSLASILAICPTEEKRTFELDLVAIAETIVVEQINDYHLSPSEKKDLAYAASALSLKRQNDLSYKHLCMTVAPLRLAPRVLYEFANVDRIDPNPTLFAAAERALKTEAKDERHLNAFIANLEDGILHTRLGTLLEVELEESTQKIISFERNVGKTDTETGFRESIGKLFNEQINEEIVKEFLTQQIISAYVITDPSNNPLIRLLDEEECLKKPKVALKLKTTASRI